MLCADNAGGQTQKHNLLINTMFIAVMLVLFLAAFAGLFWFKVFRDAYIMLNSAISVVGLLFALILFISYAAEDARGTQYSRYFAAMVLAWYFAAFLEALSRELPEVPGNIVISYIINTVSYLIRSVYWIFFWEFLHDHQRKKQKRLSTIIVMVLGGLYLLLVVINFPTGILFRIDETGAFHAFHNAILTTIYSTIFLLLFAVTILRMQESLPQRLILLSYCLFPALADILNYVYMKLGWNFYLDAVTSIASLLSLYIIFFNFYTERGRRLLRQEKELMEKQTQIMLTQIQPHFIFNALSTISSLCRLENAAGPQEAIDKFSDYLRMNLDSLKNDRFVSFEKELEHTKTYLWLEGMRFGDDLRVEYDIQYADFFLPPLTIQPLAENAVKHGICRTENGGTVRISTRKTENGVKITVEDNGAGFDPNAAPKDGKTHIGLENIRNRLDELCGGTLTIQSEIGRGTTAVIYLPQEAEK